MKLKHVFTTLGLATVMALGVGAALAHQHKEVKAVEAAFNAGEKIYLRAGSNWMEDGDGHAPRFAVYFSDGAANNEWVDMSLENEGQHIYSAVVPSTHEYSLLIFCRMNGNGDKLENKWENRYNQSSDITSIGNSKLFVVQNDSWDKDTDDAWYVKEDVWVSGNFTTPAWNTQDEYKMTFNPANYQYEIKELSIPQGKTFYIYGSTSSFVRNDKTETNDSSLFTIDDTNTKTLKETVYDIYFKPYDGKVWIEENALVAATTWSDNFISDTDAICSVGAVTDDHSAALTAIWPELKEAYEALSIGAQGLIKIGTANESIKDAHDRYLHIMARYSDVLDPFENGPAAGSSTMVTRIVENNTNNTTMMIVVIASVSIVIAAGLFFIIHRRKHQ